MTRWPPSTTIVVTQIRAALWLSDRPEYAHAILDGSKTVELRRVAPKLDAGSLIVIYATAPVMALVGAVKLGEILVDRPDRLWQRVGKRSGVDRDTFDAYFRAKEMGAALEIAARWKAARPLPLSELRASWEGFHPPQSYRYLSDQPGDQEVSVRLVDGPTLSVLPRPPGGERRDGETLSRKITGA